MGGSPANSPRRHREGGRLSFSVTSSAAPPGPSPARLPLVDCLPALHRNVRFDTPADDDDTPQKPSSNEAEEAEDALLQSLISSFQHTPLAKRRTEPPASIATVDTSVAKPNYGPTNNNNNSTPSTNVHTPTSTPPDSASARPNKKLKHSPPFTPLAEIAPE